jgi:hypothetical protein
MKFIDSHDQKISKESTTAYFNLKGELTDGESEKVFSKSLSINLGNGKFQNKYFIRVFNNQPLDPFGPEAGREIWNRTDLKQVKHTTFENYNNYLLTRNRIFLTKVNRSYING